MSLKLLCDENISGEERIILTFDSDFANILAYPPKEFFGIIRIRIHPPFNNIVMIMLNDLFNQFKTPKDFVGKLIIVEAATFRVWE